MIEKDRIYDPAKRFVRPDCLDAALKCACNVVINVLVVPVVCITRVLQREGFTVGADGETKRKMIFMGIFIAQDKPWRMNRRRFMNFRN